MSERTSKDEQSFYICGQCNDKQYYIKGENPPVPCPDCGWHHKDKRKYEVPSEIKLDLTKY